MAQFSGKVALVTGASRGIGRAVAKRLAAEGAEVVCIARTQSALEELDDEIADAGGKAVLCPLDIRDSKTLEQVAQALFQRFGRLDMLAHCAGVIGGGLAPVGHIADKHVREAFETNVIATYNLIRILDPLLRRSPAGRAVFVTDPIAAAGEPFWGLYAGSKLAMEALVRSWAAEVENITALKINLIAPPPTATRLRTIAFPGENPASLRTPESLTDSFIPLLSENCTQQGTVCRP